ncbi:MAG: serine hydrolase domain-containing protein, partial [Verrucomicrobiia bacterium]
GTPREPTPLNATLPRTTNCILDGIARGLHYGAQLYVSLGRQPVACLALGQARPGQALTVDHHLGWLSSGKPVTAAALMILVECGRADLDEPVADFIPEFAAEGKGSITLRHLLTHTAGLRNAEGASAAPSWDQIIARICRARPEKDWVPGKRAGYHYTVSWFILAEVIQRLSGQPYNTFIRQHFFEPLGCPEVGCQLSAEQWETMSDRLAPMHVVGPTGLQPHPTLDSRNEALKCKPGSGMRGPVMALGRFYEMLLNEGRWEDRQLLDPRSVSQMTRRQRHGMVDETFKFPLDWGLGFIINDPQGHGDHMPYGFGRYASPETFGHGGLQSSSGFADPRHRLAVGIIFNGQPGEAAHQQRIREVTAALYEDLGLTDR